MLLTDYHPVRTALMRRDILRDGAMIRQAQFRCGVEMQKLTTFEELVGNLVGAGCPIVDLSSLTNGLLSEAENNDDEMISSSFVGTVFIHFGQTGVVCLDNQGEPTGAYVFARRLESGAVSGVAFLVGVQGGWQDAMGKPYHEVLEDHVEARIFRYRHNVDGGYVWDMNGLDGPFMSNERAKTLMPLVQLGVDIAVGNRDGLDIEHETTTLNGGTSARLRILRASRLEPNHRALHVRS